MTNKADQNQQTKRQIHISLTLTFNSIFQPTRGEEAKLQMTKLIGVHSLFSTHRDSWVFFYRFELILAAMSMVTGSMCLSANLQIPATRFKDRIQIHTFKL